MTDKPLTEQEVQQLLVDKEALMRVDPGYEPRGVLISLARDWLWLQQRDAEKEAALVQAAEDRENLRQRLAEAEKQKQHMRAALEGALSSRVISVDNPEWAPPWVEKARDALAAMESDASS